LQPDPARVESVVFLVDRSLGRRYVVEELRASGATALALDDQFQENAPDVEWLAEASRRRWVVLSKDLFKPHERELILSTGGRAFILARGRWTGPEMAKAFRLALPGMTRRSLRTRQAFIYSISRGNQFRRVE
jgi:predicted nuclease of predicted toxin-antitoxin system